MDTKSLSCGVEAVSFADEFLAFVGQANSKREAGKVLALADNHGITSDFASEIHGWFLRKIDTIDPGVFKRVSGILDLSERSRSMFRPLFTDLLSFLVRGLVSVVDEAPSVSGDDASRTVEGLDMAVVKVCLQSFQYFPECLELVLSGKSDASAKNLQEVLTSLFEVLLKQRSSKDCCLLAGTSLALFFNVAVRCSDGVINSIALLLAALGAKDLQTVINFQFGQISVFVSVDTNKAARYASLAIMNGVLTTSRQSVLSMALRKKDGSRNILLLQFLDVLIGQCSKASDSGLKYLGFQVLMSWMQCMLAISMKAFHCEANETILFQENSSCFLSLMDLVLKHIDDLVEGIPSIVRQIFSYVLHLHAEEASLVAGGGNDQLILKLLATVMAYPWRKKGRYSLLLELIGHISASKILYLYPALRDELIRCMATCNLPPISNEVYQALLTNARKELSDDQRYLAFWQDTWLEVMVSSLKSKNKLVRQSVCQYWIPTTFALVPASFAVLENAVITSKSTVGNEYAYLALLKSGRSMAILSSRELVQRREYLESCLNDFDADLRMEALTTLCHNPRRAELLPKELFTLILDFVKVNLNCDSSKFRQQMFASLKRFLTATRDGSSAVLRKVTKSKSLQDGQRLEEVLDCIEKFISTSTSCFHPDACFQRVITGLQLFELLTHLFIYVEDVNVRPKGGPSESCKALLDHANSSGKWILFTEETVGLLFGCLEDQHDEVRELALKILKSHFKLKGESETMTCRPELFDRTIALLRSPRVQEAECGAALAELASFSASCSSETLFEYCDLYLRSAVSDFEASKADFLKAAMERAVFGHFLALTRCLNILQGKVGTCHEHQVCDYVVHLTHECEDISKTLIRLMAGSYYNPSSSSPDSSPSFADMNEALDMILSSSASFPALLKDIGLHHCRELVMSFCWLNLRSIAAVYDACSELLKATSSFREEVANSLNVMGEFYMDSLIRCRHKGVIEGSFASFCRFMKNMSNVTWFWDVSRKWLDDVISSSTDAYINTSVTKRSAGIPMFVQAMLCAEPGAENHSCLQATVTFLLQIARSPVDNTCDASADLPQFNAINILRALYRDSALGSSMLRFAEEGVVLTIDGFASLSWSIRNASTLLLGTLVPRLLGQSAGDDDERIDQKATSVALFLSHYPLLQGYFLEHLQRQVDTMFASSLRVLPRVVPILTFLSKLRADSCATSARLNEQFLPLLENLLQSPVYQVRNLAAGAILAFIPDALTILKIEEFRMKASVHREKNLLHSQLLLIKKLYVRSLQDSHIGAVSSYDLVRFLLSIPASAASSLLNRWLAFDILAMMLINGQLISEDLIPLVDLCLTALDSVGEHEVGLPLYAQQLAATIVEIVDIDPQHDILISKVLSSSNEDIRLYLFESLQCSQALVKISSPTKEVLMLHVMTGIAISTARKALAPVCLSLLKALLPDVLSSLELHSSGLLDRLHDICASVKMASSVIPCALPLYASCVSQLSTAIQDVRCEATTLLKHLLRCCSLVEMYSGWECQENLRMAAADAFVICFACCLELHLSLSPETAGSNSSFDQFDSTLVKLFSAALNLFQDEDCDIRTRSTLAFRDLPAGILAGYLKVQPGRAIYASRALNELFNVVAAVAITRARCAAWLLNLLVVDVVDLRRYESEKRANLFKQDAANLYAESTVVADLAADCYLKVYRSCSQAIREKMHDLASEFLAGLPLQLESFSEFLAVFESDAAGKFHNGAFSDRAMFSSLFKLLKGLLVASELVKMNADCLNFIASMEKRADLHASLRIVIDDLLRMRRNHLVTD